ncbi:hypothetical protein GOEFS_008_00100 [Gordonia effusa NBRC 100432]|uniref:Uncharacterized protein n=1 Tax=Gordonia effusa NBRC 100432 TaxID=1077974 RepID=H0QUV0_9ACTN|nr:hypothetical protein [Gordonia effusa]GAB16601.1 hypothetical protein GOEFS_008_00100 [Gordonia effusa NBRC 100432]
MTADPLDTLLRWSDSGAIWRVLSRNRDSITIGLFRCDGGEEVDRITSAAPELRAYVGERSSSED